MKHGTLVLPVDRARHFVELIGASCNMQFDDMNAREMTRPYKKFIQRIDEMERIIRFIKDEMERVPGTEVTSRNLDNFLEHADGYKLDDVETELKTIYRNFTRFKENNSTLVEDRNGALEERFVVQIAIDFMDRVSRSSERNTGEQFEFQASRSLLDDEEGMQRRTMETMFSNIAGVIPQAEQDRFARALFRATRGNTFTHFQQIFEPMQDPKTLKPVHKSVFVVYYQDQRIGMSNSAMAEKIRKICNSFGVNIYSWPASKEEAQETHRQLQAKVDDQEKLLRGHENYMRSETQAMVAVPRRGGNSLIAEWEYFCCKEKSIYATLNMFEGNMNLRADCWYPAADEDQIRALLIRQSSGTSSTAMLVSDRQMTKKNPPTFIRTNELTAPFQELVDTYGLPRYQEANPMLFTIITFPVLFGIMYGDIGHGTLVFCFGLYLCRNAEQLKFTALGPLVAVRYMLTMMGFFAIYAGFLYNDIFSLGVNIFGSRWDRVEDVHEATYTPLYDTRNEGGLGPYPFGIDPAWHGATNELIFMNSLKMKMSVIVGVIQMSAGLGLRWSNAFYEGNFVDFFCEAVPMTVFMVCFFGFMDFMILYKWVTPMDNPPSIINSMIAMGMFGHDDNPMFGEALPFWLMVTSICAVPIMLLPKPFILRAQHAAKAQSHHHIGELPHGGPHGQLHQGAGARYSQQTDEELSGKSEDEDEEFDFGEVFIHQIIETIEYVLGTVSHTASYLRLWALSLAHQQLALVFFQKTLLNAMYFAFPLNIIVISIMFMIWLVITLGILCGMDVMECFLHTLRLHWVEFQSKFYKADGHAFAPYRYRSLLEEKIAE